MSESPQMQVDPNKLQSTFHSIVALLPPERVAALAKLQTDDPVLHHKLLHLLRHDEAAEAANFLAAPEPVKPEPVPLRELGNYQLLEEIGHGGMGTVWKARQTRLNKIVAVKVLSENLTKDAAALARFNREMQAVGSLEHPHIVRALDADECHGTHYLVMEYVPGIDLSRAVRMRGPLPVAEACEYIRQAAVGLAHAHERGLVHRDIKPSNLLLAIEPGSAAPKGTAAPETSRIPPGSTSDLHRTTLKILDMGLARLQSSTDSQASEVTRFGQIIGTPDYMAPEQWTDTRAVDARTDLYALGCTLFHLLVGRAPFQSAENEPIGRKVLAHTLEPIPDLRKLRPDVPEAVAAIFRKLLAKRPEDRYQSAASLATELRPFATAQFGFGSSGDGARQSTSDPSVATAPMNASTIRQMELVPGLHRVRRLALWSVWVAGCCAALWLVAMFINNGFGTKQPSNRDLAAIDNRSSNSNEPSANSPERQPDPPADSGSEIRSNAPTPAQTFTPGETENPVPAKLENGNPTPAKTPEPSVNPSVNPPADPPRPIALAAEPKPERVDLPEEPPPGSSIRVPVPPPAKEQQRKPAREIPWLKMKLVHCPPGSFRMGSTDADKDAKPDETPQAEVMLSEFWLGQTEVTQEHWRGVMGPTDPWKVPGTGQTADRVMEGAEYPATSVTWNDADDFFRRLNDRERREGRLPEDLKYSLPTEAQWEYACRAGSTTRFSFGDSESELWHYGWFGGISGRGNVKDDLYPHRVAELKPNAWGLYDMHGNVMEWCADAYQTALTPGVDPRVIGGTEQVYRGGSWLSYAEDCRASRRFHAFPLKRDPKNQFAFRNNPVLGFRVALVSTGAAR